MSDPARPWRRDGEGLVLSVRLTPGARSAGLGGAWRDSKGEPWLAARVTAPPDKGRANAALIALLASALDVAPTSISLAAGATARLKRLRIAPAGDSVTAALDTYVERT